MKKPVLLECAFIVWAVLLVSCDNYGPDKFSNPLDSKTSDRRAADLLNQHPEWLNINPSTGEPFFWDSIQSHLPKDTIPPKIQILGDDTVRIPRGDPKNMVVYYMQQVKATDDGGKVIGVDTSHNINIFAINAVNEPYKITYIFSDSSGNTATATRYVYIFEAPTVDITPPVITFMDTILYVLLGQPYTDVGVSAYDEPDGNITGKIVKSGEVDINKVGEYVLTYTVSDEAGNATTKTRKVIVREDTGGPDRVIPIITLKPPDTIKLGEGVKIPDYMKTYKEPGYTAVDNVDGDITVKVIAGEIQKLEGKVWYLTYNVNDAAGNAAETKRRYFLTTYVDNNLPPIIDLEFPDSVIQLVIPASGKAIWKEPGFTASDVVDGDLTGKVTVDSSTLVANLGVLGTYTVLYRVTNGAGLTTTATRLVSIVDNPYDITPPVITLKGKNPDSVVFKTPYKDPGATALDNRDGDLTAKITVSGTVNVNTLGKNTLTYSVTDKAGLVGRATRTVFVIRDTACTDLFTCYAVPTEDPLPTLQGKFYLKFTIDGEGPDLNNITKMNFSWDRTNKTLNDFSIQLTVDPYYKSLVGSVKHTFDSANPEMTLSGTGIAGLDGTYYVAVGVGELYWVRKDKKFAVIWIE